MGDTHPFALALRPTHACGMSYPDYALPILDISRDIQKDFEALSGAVLKVPRDKVDSIETLSRQLLSLRMAINAWVSQQRVD